MPHKKTSLPANKKCRYYSGWSFLPRRYQITKFHKESL